VVYASSSSALATGSALTFDGTNLGLGGTSASARLYVNANNATATQILQDETNGAKLRVITNSINVDFGNSGGGGYIAVSGANPLTFNTNGAEGFRLTSSSLYTASGINVGIGTSTMTRAFNISGTTAGVGLNINNTGTSGRSYSIFSTNSGASVVGALAFFDDTASAYRMILDSSGNLGLGVTPNTWSDGKAIEVGGTGNSIWGNGANSLQLMANAYYNGGYKYAGTGLASRYFQSDGVHAWLNAASGTAGNPITFTQAMTLDASGYLLVGATSSAGVGANRLQVGSSGSAAQILAKSATNHIGLYASSGADSYMSYATGAALLIGNGPADGSTFTERARIDSSGNFMVGVASATYHTIYKNNANDWAFRVQNPSATAYGMNINLSASPNNTTQEAFRVEDSIASRLVIYSNGNVQNTNNSYGSLSDVKLKENIVDASPKLADLMQVKVRNYNLIGSTTKQIGVVAQELETVFPSMIDVTPDRDAKNNDLGTTTKSVKYSVFVPMLIKAMQEQQAIIESLKARLDAANL
jgi:hypothetical protein